MSVASALNAERIKLVTVRSPLWSGIVAAVCSLGIAGLQGATAYGTAGLPPERAAIGVVVFGVPVLMVLAAMTVTGEYRTGMITATFTANPNRATVLVAKAVVAAVASGVFTVLLTIAGLTVARLSADPLLGAQLSLADGAAWRVVGAVTSYAALAAVLGVGVGALLRHTAGATALLLLWPLIVEPVLANLPDVGARVEPFLPFGNAFAYVEVQWLYPRYDMPWGPFGSLVYFVVVVAAVFVSSVVLVNRRDA
jgi:ABC-2 type transport system permease protein